MNNNKEKTIKYLKAAKDNHQSSFKELKSLECFNKIKNDKKFLNLFN